MLTNKPSPQGARLSPLLCVAVTLTLSLSVARADLTVQAGQAFRDAERMSSSEKLKRASQAVPQLQQMLKLTLKSLKEAYDKKDIKQTNCVKAHLSPLKNLVRIAEEADVSLREAVVTGDLNIINHEFVKISMALDRAQRAQALASGCVGDLDDPIVTSKGSSKPEIFDKAVQDFTPSSDEQSVITYDSITSERPEAISQSE
jgi:hypothetical protein